MNLNVVARPDVLYQLHQLPPNLLSFYVVDFIRISRGGEVIALLRGRVLHLCQQQLSGCVVQQALKGRQKNVDSIEVEGSELGTATQGW